MYRKEGKWCLLGSTQPYTGKFIDYYFSGIKKQEGSLQDGLDEGLCNSYYKDGKSACYKNYIKGTANGEYGEYFPNGKLKQAGIFKNGKEEGLWKEWYSTGNLKRERVFATGVELPASESNAGYAFMTKGIESFSKGDYKQALTYYSKAIELNPSYYKAYNNLGILKASALKNFPEAIADFTKAIEIDPNLPDAWLSRGTCWLGLKQIEKACPDWRKAQSLGNQQAMKMLEKYCK